MKKPIKMTRSQLASITPGVLLREVHSAGHTYRAWIGKPRMVTEIIQRTKDKVWFKYQCGEAQYNGSAELGKRTNAYDYDYPIASRWIFEGDPVPAGYAEAPFSFREY